MAAWQTVDRYLGELKAAGKTGFTAWGLDQWLRTNAPAWHGQASFMLQHHKWAQSQGWTTHRCYCTRRGPDAPWRLEHQGSWKRAAEIKTQQLCFRDLWVDHACRALPMAKAEDARNGHVKVGASDPDGPVLADCKAYLRNQGYGLNAMLVGMGLVAVDVERVLARY